MKSFKNFIISEEVDLTAGVESGKINVDDHAVRNNINSFLNGELACNVVTPYVALNKVNKVLANFNIFLPKAPYMEDSHGVHVFNIKQFGRVAGMKNDGSVVTKIEQPYHLYFEWKRNERGMFNVFAEIVTDEELSDLLNAVEDDVKNTEDDRDEKIYEETEEKEIKKAYKVAAKNPDASKVRKHLKAAAKIVKKKLERGEKIDEEQLDEVSEKKLRDYSGKATMRYLEIGHGDKPGTQREFMKRMKGAELADKKIKKKEDERKSKEMENYDKGDLKKMYWREEALAEAASILKKKT